MAHDAMDLPAVLDRAAELIDGACLLDDDSQADTLLEQAIMLLEAVQRDDAGAASADVAYRLGLAWYDRPGETTARSRAVRAALYRALRLEPQHQSARLYLGHIEFDEGRYAEALRWFTTCDEQYFTDVMGQRWRACKTDELILCCQLRLGAIDDLLIDLRQLVDAYLAMDPSKDLSAVPIELFRTMCEEAETGRLTGPQLAAALPELRRLAVGLDDVDLLGPQLARLEASAP